MLGPWKVSCWLLRLWLLLVGLVVDKEVLLLPFRMGFVFDVHFLKENQHVHHRRLLRIAHFGEVYRNFEAFHVDLEVFFDFELIKDLLHLAHILRDGQGIECSCAGAKAAEHILGLGQSCMQVDRFLFHGFFRLMRPSDFLSHET
mgnify:CR=1 FL=1